MFGSFGMMELVLVLVIVLIIFGAGRLPQLGEGLGKAIRGFKKSVHEAETIEVQADQTSPPSQQPRPPEDPAPHAPNRSDLSQSQDQPADARGGKADSRSQGSGP